MSAIAATITHDKGMVVIDFHVAPLISAIIVSAQITDKNWIVRVGDVDK